MRRLFLALLIVAVISTASVLAVRANRSADAVAQGTTEVTDSLSTPILNVRRIPEWLRRPTSDQEFAEALAGVLNQPAIPEARCLQVHRNGIEIAVEQPDAGLVPAELQRLVTVAAVESFPKESVFVTKVVINEASGLNDGVLDGNIFLVGGGDPVLSTNDYLKRFDDDRAATNFDELAAELAAGLRLRGISAISGGVVGDEFRFSPSETDYVGTVWTETDNADNVVGPLSGLLVNDGFYWDRQTRTVSRSQDPALLAAEILTDELTRRGIAIAAEPTTGEQPASAEQILLASTESPSIAEIAQRALIDGTTAEMLFKEVGRVNGLSPASNDATFGMLVTLLEQGLPVEGSRPLDGSGLSTRNRVTCDLLMAIIEGRSVGGIVDLSLTDIAAGSLAACAPTGVVNMQIISADRADVSALVGEMLADNGAIITFAFVVNADLETNVVVPLGKCNRLQTSLLEAVAGYPDRYGPTLDSLSPVAVEPATDGLS